MKIVEPLLGIATLHIRFNRPGSAVKLVKAVLALFSELRRLVVRICTWFPEHQLNKVDQALAEVRTQMPNVSTTRY